MSPFGTAQYAKKRMDMFNKPTKELAEFLTFPTSWCDKTEVKPVRAGGFLLMAPNWKGMLPMARSRLQIVGKLFKRVRKKAPL